MAHSPSDSESDLLDRFVARELTDREVSSRLFDKYYPALTFAASKFGVPESDREAIASAALSNAVRFLVAHRTPESFFAVLMIGFRKRVNDARTKAGLQPYVPLDDHGVAKRDTALVRAVLDGLMSEDEAQLILLRYLEGVSVENIAAARNELVEAVSAKLTRADTLFANAITETAEA